MFLTDTYQVRKKLPTREIVIGEWVSENVIRDIESLPIHKNNGNSIDRAVSIHVFSEE